MGIMGTNYPAPARPVATASGELTPPPDQAMAIHDYHLNEATKGRTEETAMYPINSYEQAKARAADWHHQAQRDALARAARRARRARPHESGHPVPALPFRRRVLAMLGARST